MGLTRNRAIRAEGFATWPTHQASLLLAGLARRTSLVFALLMLFGHPSDLLAATKHHHHKRHRHHVVEVPRDDDIEAPAEDNQSTMQPAGVSEAVTSPERAELLKIASRYAAMSYVPYVWGGSKIGSKSQCMACRACAEESGASIGQRSHACRACRQCGIDCSHFVNKVYSEAGLDYSYLTSHEMHHLPDAKLRKDYDLIDIGHDLTRAKPGDLLVYKRHVVMLLRNAGDGRHGDIIHATRYKGEDLVGGIRFDVNRQLVTASRRVLRILRHVKLFAEPSPVPVVNEGYLLTVAKPEPFSTPFTRLESDFEQQVKL